MRSFLFVLLFGLLALSQPAAHGQTFEVLYADNQGREPSVRLVQGRDGNFYGTTQYGGVSDYGTIFKVTPSGEFSTLVSFNSKNGRYPTSGLVQGRDGNLYGTTQFGGLSDYGTVFKVTPSGEFSTLVSFNSSNGRYPSAELLEGSDGIFYGTTESGGSSNYGTVFKITPSGVLTSLVSFNSSHGNSPSAQLVEGRDGNFYSTTQYGGVSGDGTVFKVTPSGVLTTLVSFNSPNSRLPKAGLVEGSDGNFYGTTVSGGNGYAGTVFKVTPEGKLTTLASVGDYPHSALMEGSDGNFYGTTNMGGVNQYGTIFRTTPEGALTRLVSFDLANGSIPYGGLVEGNDGNFYGTTSSGGASGRGTIFKMTPAGALTTLVSFNNSNGRSPLTKMVKGTDGNFYGTTKYGGASGYGTIFRVTTAGVLTTLYSFDGVVAANPECTPFFGSDGKIYGTAAPMAIWRLSVPIFPGVTAIPPGAITTTGATLSGRVNASGSDTAVLFEYGTTTNYGSIIVATPGTVTGKNETAVSAALSGLAPHTTYFYRLTASNSDGSTSTSGSFTTANTLPVAVSDSFVPAANDFEPMTLAVLGNDSDADGDALTVTGVTQGLVGTVATDGATLTYTPGPAFLGRDTFTYTISDGFDTTTAQVRIQASTPFTRALLAQATEVPRAGQEGSGIPAGSLFKSFGVPAINSSGKLAYTASYAPPGSATELAIFGFEPKELKSTVTARRGQTAPGTEGALFSSFKDPLLNEAGDVVFQATLSGGDTTKQNRGGLWISSITEAGDLGLELIARTGSQPPGVPAGARWKSFVDVAFSSSSSADGQGWSLAFTGFMSTGGGGVTANSDMGLWIVSSDAAVLALREGQKLFVGETEKQIRSFAALKSLPNAAGQGGGMTSSGGVAVQVFFKDSSQAVLQLGYDKAADKLTIDTVALSGDAVAEQEESAAKFGVPTQSSSGTTTAWLGSLSGKMNPAAVFERSLSEPELLKLLARKGDAAPGIDGASFSSFRSVAVADSGSALLLGKVIGKGIGSSSDEGLWWKHTSASADVTSSFQLLAWEGTQPPGAPQGAKWTAFTSVALLEGPYGPLFTARIVRAKGKAGDSWGSSANDQGLWAVDSNGELQLIAREGQELIVEGSSTPKTLKSFTVLSAVPGSPAQRRSFADDGQIVYRALFTDGSQAVINVQLP